MPAYVDEPQEDGTYLRRVLRPSKRRFPCEGSGRRVSTPAMHGVEEKCPCCHYWATPIYKYGEWCVRSHRAVKNDPYADEESRYQSYRDSDLR